ncbi:MAG: hypothetical protein JW941_02030 [Candidatus Coatesbacteria bacterium]|nr:hypothetical protein [Candidatus Coatesbacteria bacterium]
MKLTERDRKILIVGGVAVGLFILFKFAIAPIFAYSQELSDKIEDLQFKYEKSVKIISERPAAEYELNELKSIGSGLDSRLIPSTNTNVAGAKLQQTLDSLLQRSRLSTRSKKILKNEERGGFVAVPVELSATGSLSELKDFLSRLLDDRMILHVKKLELRPENQRDPQKIFIEITVVGFVLKELP